MKSKSVDRMAATMAPSIKLLCKLGSIVVHVDEGLSAHGHPFDVIVLRSLVEDPEVKAWVAAMGALLPKKRR